MKFSVVIGNPPYQHGKNSNFYVSFIDKASTLLNEGGWISLITPNRFVMPHSPASQTLRSSFQIEKMRVNVNQYFPGVGQTIGVFNGRRSNTGHHGECLMVLGCGETIKADPSQTSVPSKTPTRDGINRWIDIKEQDHYTFTTRKPSHNNYVFVWRQWKSENGRIFFDAEVSNTVPFEGAKDGRYIEVDDPEPVCKYLRESNTAQRIHDLWGDQMNIWPFLWKYIPTLKPVVLSPKGIEVLF